MQKLPGAYQNRHPDKCAKTANALRIHLESSAFAISLPPPSALTSPASATGSISTGTSTGTSGATTDTSGWSTGTSTGVPARAEYILSSVAPSTQRPSASVGRRAPAAVATILWVDWPFSERNTCAICLWIEIVIGGVLLWLFVIHMERARVLPGTRLRCLVLKNPLKVMLLYEYIECIVLAIP